MTAEETLREVITRIDEARYANEDTTSPWVNASVLELLTHLREPYTTAEPSVRPPTREQPAPSAEQIAALDRLRADLAHGQEFGNRNIVIRVADLDAVLALFQQPTPSADPTCTCGHIMDDHDLSETGECQVAIPWCPCKTAKNAAEPVSIADMAPGNLAYVHLNTNTHCACPAYERARDVTPPPATPEEGDRG